MAQQTYSFYSLASIFGVSDSLSNVCDPEKEPLKNQKEFHAGDYWRTWGLFGMF